MNNNTEIKIKGFRAIHSADIVLNGITVIAGINGCGKSTISKLLYYAFDSANSMDSIFLSNLIIGIHPITEIYEQLADTYVGLVEKYTFRTLLSKDMNRARLQLEKVTKQFQENWANNPESPAVARLCQIINYNIGTTVTIKNVVETLLNHFDEQIAIYNYRKENRPVKSLDAKISSLFDEKTLLDNIKIFEYGVPFFDKDVVKVPFLHNIKDATYIESPLAINFSKGWHTEVEESSWALHLKLTNNQSSNDEINSIENYIGSSIIDGDILFNADADEIVYQRNDGQTFPLQDCATGIKSFAMLKLLVKNGQINDRSLIIIDEPEAHLHPQWIVEYAKIIVELNKQVGAKFFIATHSTDMVSALRYISEKEETLERLAFYNAVPAKENPYTFDYEALEADIEPIFASFNKSFDLIEQYGADSGI